MTKRLAILSFIIFVGSVWIPSIVSADTFQEIQEQHWLEAMEISGVDSELLYAIALQESGTSFKGMRSYGPWPWTMNIREKSMFYSSREAARKALAAEIEIENDRVAVGMWQIYLKYNGDYVENALDLLDPVTNLYTAAMVLKDCGKEYSTTRHVLACYYSGDPDKKGLKYAESVIAKANKWGRPFEISKGIVAVRFSHKDKISSTSNAQNSLDFERNEAQTIASLGSVEANVVGDETSGQMGLRKPAISLELLAGVKKPFVPQSHSDFLAKLEKRNTSWEQRVIVVE